MISKINREYPFQKPIEKWGKDKQLDMVQEEAAELISSINKWRRGRNTDGELASEIADVIIMLQQLIYIFPDGDEMVSEKYEYKLNRLSKRINE